LVDLFCGCGGFSLGAHSAGFEVAAAYDIDEILASSYSTNFPGTKLFHRDISTVTGAEIRAAVDGEVGGIFGGPPCQGFSDIGRRSTKDPRRELLRHFFRLVSEVEPSFFVMENVRGLAYADALPLLVDALALVRSGYDVLGPHIWDASEFGAATKRNRIFVIGIRKDLKTPIEKAAIEAFKRPAATVKAAIADLIEARVTRVPGSIGGRFVVAAHPRTMLGRSERPTRCSRGIVQPSIRKPSSIVSRRSNPVGSIRSADTPDSSGTGNARRCGLGRAPIKDRIRQCGRSIQRRVA